ncbi:asparagine synthetase B family protein [Seongchinamella sediminis]|nr:asparagine synthase-related protein [Seongchinamella sediminis]
MAIEAGSLARCMQRQLSVAIQGLPQWQDAELAGMAQRHGHAAALLEGYHRNGSKVLEILHGGFALVVQDTGKGNLALLACDRSGIVPLFHAASGDGLVFGSRADQVAAHPGVDDALHPQALYDYLYFHIVPGPETVFTGVQRLQPGECLYCEENETRLDRYWVMEYDEQGLEGNPAQWRQQFLDLVRTAVQRRADDGVKVGAFLSGGTDSSTVSGMLSQLGEEPARTYSIGFNAPGYDEMEYARLVARHFNTEHHEYYVTAEDVVAAIPQVARQFDQPFANASAVPSYYCARMAKEDGIERLLAGDGGDELFGGNYRYAKQQMFSWYERVPRSLRRLAVEPVLLRTPLGDLGPARKLSSYIQQAVLPMPERMESYNLLDRLGPRKVLTDSALSRIDTGAPMRLIRETYHSAQTRQMLNRMLAVDMRFTLADSDLPKVTGACSMAGIEVDFPFLDDDLVAFSALLPVREKVRGTRLRHLFKEALRGFLPDEVLTKKKQGFGLPFGLWLVEHPGLRELTHDSLTSLKRRDLVRPEFIDELLGRHHGEHAAYYGTMVWTLLMLEQWLAARERP